MKLLRMAGSTDMDRSIMAALGLSDAADVDTVSLDDQRDYLMHNTPRLDEADLHSVYRIAYRQGCEKLFHPQGAGQLAINIDKIPDDIIHQMYLQAVIFLDRMKNASI